MASTSLIQIIRSLQTVLVERVGDLKSETINRRLREESNLILT